MVSLDFRIKNTVLIIDTLFIFVIKKSQRLSRK